MRVDQAGQHGAAGAVDLARAVRRVYPVADLRDETVGDEQVSGDIEPLGGIVETRATNHHPILIARGETEADHAIPRSAAWSRRSITVPMAGRVIRS